MGRYKLVNPLLQHEEPPVVNASSLKDAAKKMATTFIKNNMPIDLRKVGAEAPLYISLVELDERGDDIQKYGNIENDWEHFEIRIKRSEENKKKSYITKIKSYTIPNKKKVKGTAEIPSFINEKMLIQAGGAKKKGKKKSGSSLKKLNLSKYSSWYSYYNYYYYVPYIYRDSKYLSWSYWYPYVNVYYPYSMGLLYWWTW